MRGKGGGEEEISESTNRKSCSGEGDNVPHANVKLEKTSTKGVLTRKKAVRAPHSRGKGECPTEATVRGPRAARKTGLKKQITVGNGVATSAPRTVYRERNRHHSDHPKRGSREDVFRKQQKRGTKTMRRRWCRKVTKEGKSKEETLGEERSTTSLIQPRMGGREWVLSRGMGGVGGGGGGVGGWGGGVTYSETFDLRGEMIVHSKGRRKSRMTEGTCRLARRGLHIFLREETERFV